MSTKKKTILIVDDDVDLLNQMKMIIEADGYETITAGSEKEAAEILEKQKPNLAVLDLMMENMDSGFKLAYKIKKMDESIPVILVTSVTNETGIQFDAATREEKSWIKADAFIQKDIRYEQLRGEIQRLIKE